MIPQDLEDIKQPSSGWISLGILWMILWMSLVMFKLSLFQASSLDWKGLSHFKIPINDWLFKFCEFLEIEDEYHLVMSCPLFKFQRDTLLNSLCATFDINSLSMKIFLNDYEC